MEIKVRDDGRGDRQISTWLYGQWFGFHIQLSDMEYLVDFSINDDHLELTGSGPYEEKKYLSREDRDKIKNFFSYNNLRKYYSINDLVYAYPLITCALEIAYEVGYYNIFAKRDIELLLTPLYNHSHSPSWFTCYGLLVLESTIQNVDLLLEYQDNSEHSNSDEDCIYYNSMRPWLACYGLLALGLPTATIEQLIPPIEIKDDLPRNHIF